MAGNYTLTIIKPDAFGAGKAGKIIAHLEQQGFKVLAARVMHMSQAAGGRVLRRAQASGRSTDRWCRS